MRIRVRPLLVVVCLFTAIAAFVGRRQDMSVDTARVAAVVPADQRSVPRNGVSHPPPIQPATAGNQPPPPEVAVERASTDAVEVARNPVPGTEVFEEFDRWLEEYSAAKSLPDRKGLEREGESLALARRPVLARLIESDPERALRCAVPMKRRSELPASIAQHLEERVGGLARYDVLALLGRPEQPQPKPAIERSVTLNNRTFKAFVYGRRVLQTSKEAIPLHGIAVGNALAVHESPVRVFEPGESPSPSLPVANADGRCPISKQAASPAVAVEVGGEIVHLCHAGHIEALTEELEAQEAGIGPRSRTATELPGAFSWSRGPKSVLFMRVSFPDDSEESISESEASDLMRQVDDFFVENSYGTTSLAATVTPLLTLPAPKAWYASANAYTSLLSDARTAAAAAGYDTANFDFDCVHLKPVFSSSLSYIGAKGAWLEDRSPGTACHEFGHNYGLWHANAWKTSDGSVIGSGANSEYGNVFDTMGYGIWGSWQFNACHKNILGWLPNAVVQTVSSDGVYELDPFDVPSLAEGLTYALRIQKDSQRSYWIETRQALALAPAFPGGVLINWSPWSGSDGGSQLLHTTPGSGGSMSEAPLLAGRSFYDSSIGLKVTPRNRGGTTPGSIDVLVAHVHYLPVEAEGAILTPPTSVIEDPLASQHQCIASPASDQGGALWTLDIPAAGEYTIWCRVRQDPAGAVPWSVSVDGESEQLDAMVGSTGSSEWQWCRLVEWPPQASPDVAPRLLALNAGTHTVRLAGGGQGSKLDCLLFTDDPATNPPPVFPAIADQATVAGTLGLSIPFTIVGIGTALSAFRLTARSSNPALVPETNIVFGGGDLNRTVTVTPAPGQSGAASITLNVTDPNGNQAATTFSLTVTGPIQALVSTASPGDTVIVPAGTYVDHVTIDRNILLQGAGAGATVIDANNLGVPLTITSNATVTIRNLTLRQGSGGGLRNHGSATLDRCAVCDNHGSADGGGIWNGDNASLVLQDCTVSSNRCSGGDGGGIYNAGTLTAHTITVSGNRATGKDDKGNGGGIYNANALVVRNSTLAGNRAANNGGGLANVGTATLQSTIVAGNSVSVGEGPDCHGTLTSAGYNLFQVPDGFLLVGDVTGNLVGQDPRLGPLQDNGGSTLTHALLRDSPAIDQGKLGDRAIDQRGVSRPLDVPGVANASDACDIGAYEWVPEIRPSLTISREPNGDVTVSLSGGWGTSWRIQASPDFMTWRTVTTIVMVSDSAEINDPSAHQYPCLFYRAIPE